jgi:spore coat protein U-like protein
MSSARRKNAAARAVHILAGALCALVPGAALAGDDTDTFTVSATVLATCEVIADDLEFGDYDPVQASPLDAETSLSVTCTSGTPYTLGLSLGDGAGASVANRYMQDGADQLAYILYQNSGRTTLWGESSNTLAGVGDGIADTIDVFGRVPMQQAAPAGEYEDTITVTVTW